MSTNAGLPTRREILFAAALIVAFTALPAICRAATITVTTTNDFGAGSLREAIIQAAPGDSIHFSVTGTISLLGELPPIRDNLIITGPATFPRIIIDGNHQVQVIAVGRGATLKLANLTIVRGFSALEGGAILNEGTLTVTNCVFIGNGVSNFETSVRGGAIFNGGRLTVRNSAFLTNEASGIFGAGGAIANIQGTISIANSAFNGNRASGLIGSGGALSNFEGTLTVANSTFSGNQANGTRQGENDTGQGGAIVNDIGGTSTIADSTFTGNQSTGVFFAGSGGEAIGGALLNKGKTLTITNSTFAGNQVSATRGGLGQGGAIFNTRAAALTITNATFSANSATAGPGGGSGGAIYNSSGTLNIKGSILAGSVGGNCASAAAGSPVTDRGYNISDDRSCGFTATGLALNGDDVDPRLAAGLANNGGPTKTVALLTSSPAIDQIPIGLCTDFASGNQLKTDQRGYGRPDPGDGPNGNCDIGAYEHGAVPLPGAGPPIICDQPAATKPNLVARPSAFFPEQITGVGDPGGAFSVKIIAITQDKPVAGEGAHCRDAFGVGSNTARLRAISRGKGGLIYTLAFTATDRASGIACTSTAAVCVQTPSEQGECIDTGKVYDATRCR
jgi:hypothetical protein